MTSVSHAPIELEYRPLHRGHPLGLLHDACLALRAPRYATCRACEDACPVNAIRVGETAIELAEDCVRCGRCAAACPMGALAHPGFSVPDVARGSAGPLSVDCWKVPAKLSPEGAVRVPCLGGLSPARILELAAVAGARPLELLDRGWCSGCSAGGQGGHPVDAHLQQAGSLLTAAGIGKLPGLRSLPLPADLMPLEIPAPVTEAKLARRGFFSALAGNAAVTIDRVKPLGPQLNVPRRRGFEREPVASRERERLLAAMALIGKAAGVARPPILFHRVAVSDACNNDQLCASVCPTGALSVLKDGHRTELMFDTRRCIGCDECSSICPSSAVRVLPNGYEAAPDELPNLPIRLTSFEEKSCPECRRTYVEKAGEDRCPQCHKRHQLASSAFQSLFGAGRQI